MTLTSLTTHLAATGLALLVTASAADAGFLGATSIEARAVEVPATANELQTALLPPDASVSDQIADQVEVSEALLASRVERTACQPKGVTVNDDIVLIECRPGTIEGGHPGLYAVAVGSPKAPLFLQLVQTARSFGADDVILEGFPNGADNPRYVWGANINKSAKKLFIEFEDNTLYNPPGCGDDCRSLRSLGATQDSPRIHVPGEVD